MLTPASPGVVDRVHTLEDLARHEATDLVLVEGYGSPVMAFIAQVLLPAPAPAARRRGPPRHELGRCGCAAPLIVAWSP